MNRRRNVRPLLLEQLEDRTVLSPTIFTVTGIGDSPSDPHTATSGDLRYCVNLADAKTSNPDGSLIQFDPTVFSLPQTITLGSTLILSNTGDQTTITGPVAALNVSGGGSSSNFSVFTVNSGVTASISGLTISNGKAPNGGGVYNAGSLTLTDDTLSGNSAQSYGGGVYNVRGTATLTNDTLSGNSAKSYGGGVYNGGTATLTNDTLSGNSAHSGNLAQSDGGGVYNGGTATLTNDTLFGNSAHSDGGGVYNGGTATLTNDTLSGNSAQYNGGGVYNDGTATLNNTVVDNSPSGGDIYRSVSGSNNLIDASTAGGLTNGVNGNIVGVNPLLAPLGNYGGPTQTMPPLPGSPVIGAGSTVLIPAGITTDQRGEPRIVNGTVDIGAFESQPAPQPYKLVKEVELVPVTKLVKETELVPVVKLVKETELVKVNNKLVKQIKLVDETKLVKETKPIKETELVKKIELVKAYY